jgi:tetratricopeptide (TPR) repeat protein
MISRRIPLVLVVLLALVGAIRAETVFLKSGSKITGKILEDTAEKVRIEVDVEGGGKAVMTIERSRIDRIETETTRAEKIAAADALLALADFRHAEEEFRELVRQEPKDHLARLGLAKSLVGIFRYEEAIKTLEHYLLLVDQDRNTDLMLYLADQYLQAHNYRDAKDVAREAAALYPADRGLQATVDEFVKRCDRVKAGIEQIEERQTAEGAERDRRVKERREWDKERGNSFEACEMGQAILDWTAESNSTLILGSFMEVDADKAVWGAYMAGGEAGALQEAVTRAELKLTVDETRWTEMYDHVKAVLINGWYYQMKQRYPKTFPSVTVVCITKENGKDKEKKLARGSWDGRKEKVVVDRWTKENRDPVRPVRRVVK